MNTIYKTLLIENESEFIDSFLKKTENINSLDELIEFLDELISIQYYKGIFNDPDEYDELISSKINEIIENEFKPDEDASENMIKALKLDESIYKYYLYELLEYYDIYLSDINGYISNYEDNKTKIKYLLDLYASDEIKKPEYLDELYSYDEDAIIEEINDLLSDMISSMKYNYNTKSYDCWILDYFNYDEYISDLIDSEEIIKIDEDEYIKDMNIYPYA